MHPYTNSDGKQYPLKKMVDNEIDNVKKYMCAGEVENKKKRFVS